MKLWHDDIRRPPDDSWTWTRSNEEAKLVLLSHFDAITEASLDHDMGLHDFDPDQQDAEIMVAPDAANQPDGTELVKWMIENDRVPPRVTVHSMNYDGRRRMVALLREAGCSEVIDREFELSVLP